MGKVTNDGFLSSLDKMLQAAKDTGSVTLTLKRLIKPENGKYKPGRKQKQEIISQENQKVLADPDRKYNLVLKAKTDDSKASTEVEAARASAFHNSLINVCRLRFFKGAQKVEKKLRKPTAKNPNSKRSKKLEAKKKLKKLKNMKKKEKTIQKRFATKTTTAAKMDIETSK